MGSLPTRVCLARELRIATFGNCFHQVMDGITTRHQKRESSVPTFMELQKRLRRHDRVNIRLGSEEELVVDVRGKMRPGEFIDQKLRAAQRIESTDVETAPAPQLSLRN